MIRFFILAFVTTLMEPSDPASPINSLWLGLVLKMNFTNGQNYFSWADNTPIDYTYWVPGDPTLPMDDYLIKVGRMGLS